MRRLIVWLVCWMSLMPPAWAGIEDWRAVQWVKNAASYAWSPVNCPLDYVRGNIAAHATERGDLWDLLGCVGNNLNRNPATLSPLIQ